MILRTIFSCNPCAANSAASGVYPRVVIDSVESERYSVLGCPICASHDLKVESIEPADAPPTPNTAPPAPEPAPAAASPGAPSEAEATPANDTKALPAPPVLAQNEVEAKERKADFIQLPSIVRCVECGETLSFNVSERMADVLVKAGWTSGPPRGVLCDKHGAPAKASAEN